MPASTPNPGQRETVIFSDTSFFLLGDSLAHLPVGSLSASQVSEQNRLLCTLRQGVCAHVCIIRQTDWKETFSKLMAPMSLGIYC